MTETIYMPLENEGLPVRRPVPAYRRDDGKYIVLRPTDYDPSIKQWSFPPGSTVEVQKMTTPAGEILAAISEVKVPATAPSYLVFDVAPLGGKPDLKPLQFPVSPRRRK